MIIRGGKIGGGNIPIRNFFLSDAASLGTAHMMEVD